MTSYRTTGRERFVAERRFLGEKVHWTGGEGRVLSVRIADIESGVYDAGDHLVADVEVFPTYRYGRMVPNPNKVIPLADLHLTPECRPVQQGSVRFEETMKPPTLSPFSPGIEPLFSQRFYQRKLPDAYEAIAKAVQQGGIRREEMFIHPAIPTVADAMAALDEMSARASGRKRSATPVSIQDLDEQVQKLVDKMKALTGGGDIIDMSLLRPEGNPIIELARKVREGKAIMTQPNEPLFEFPKPAWSASHSVVVPYKSSMGPIHRDQLWGWEDAPKHGIAVAGKTLKVTSNNVVEREVKESTAAFASVTTYRDVVSTTTHYPPEYADELREVLVGRCVIVDDYSDQARVARVTGILTREQSYDGLGVCFTSVVDAGSGGVRPLSEVRPATRKELTDWATRLTIVLSGVACEFTWGEETRSGKIASVSYDVVADAFYVYTYSHDGRIPATTVTIPYHERNEPLDLQEGETTAPADAINDRPTIEIDEPSAAERLFGSEPQPEDDGPVPPEAGNTTTAADDLPLLTPVLTLETGLLSAPFQDTVINDSYQKALASGRYDHLLIVRDRETETPMIRVMGTLKTADPIVMKIEIDTDAVHEALAELREDFAATREVLRPRGVVGETEIRDGDEFTELTTEAAKDLLGAMASGASLGGYNATDLAETREAVESLPDDGVVTFGAHNLPVEVALEIADAWQESNPEIAKFMRERHANNPDATGITMAIESIPRDEFLLALAVLEKHIGAEEPQMVDDTDDKRLHGVQSIFALGFLTLLEELHNFGPQEAEQIRAALGAVPMKGLEFFLDDLVEQGLASRTEGYYAATPRGSIVYALSALEASLPQRAGFNVNEIAAQASLLPAQVEKNLAKVIETGTVSVVSIDPDREYKLCL